MLRLRVIVERHADGFIAYPLGVDAVVVGKGASSEEAFADVRSAIRFHVDTFGTESLGCESPVLEPFVTETEVAI
jgi:hypothetical protein